MRKLLVLAVVLVGLAVPVVAYAADLNPNQEDQFTCEFGGTWHFVNVQPGTTTPALLDAFFSGGDVLDVSPSKVNNGTQHWNITATGTLEGATTGAQTGGFIVLSDFECNEKKDKK